MTETEAKTKWCPLARIGFAQSVPAAIALTAVNIIKIDDGPEKRTFCIGSGCIMWRFQPFTDGSANHEQGYCGLAGKP